MFQKGIASLETAALIMLVAVFGMGGVAVVGYLGELSKLHRIVDQALIADTIKPFRLSSEGASGVVLELNNIELGSYLDRTLSALRSGIGTELPYRIELQYAVLKINQSTGFFEGFDAIPDSTRNEGDFTAPSSACPELASRLIELGQEIQADGSSRYAIPSGISGINGGSFLARSVVVLVRAIKDLRNTSGGLLYSTALNEIPAAVSCKSILLRGEVQD